MIDNQKKASSSHMPTIGGQQSAGDQSDKNSASLPSVSLPKGGGAIRGIGEKFAANPVTGTGSITVPIAVSPGRSGFGPQLALSYDSGAGNGPFGLGWNLSLPAITRKTDKGLPKYQDSEGSDVFILSGAEDLMPVLDNTGVVAETERDGYRIRSYRPRIEGLFARIERWTRFSDGDVHWRSISKDNLLTIYGKDRESRIFDPLAPRRIFSWLICETRDDKGNGIVYEYVGENSVAIGLSHANEANRGDADSPLRTANRYIKRIRYGNKTSLLDNVGKRPLFLTGNALADAGWMFEVVFDYGDEPYVESLPDAEKRVFVQLTISDSPGRSWPVRRDPFSTYRSGFEVRTYRLCRRAMMFHHFPDELGPDESSMDDYLVRSTEFAYDEKPIASFIRGITQSGYLRQQDGSYLKRSLPPVEFDYSKAEIQNEVLELDVESLENLPAGLDGANYQWIDLDGDGVAGILAEQAGAWFYKRNLSPISTIQENGATHTVAKFAPIEIVAAHPSFNGIASGGMQFLDLAGDGRPDLVQFDGPDPGFFEFTDENVWEPHRHFKSLPKVNWRDPNLKFIDLTGDGRADILISEDEVFTWYPSLSEDGFGPGLRVQNTFDEENGPRLVFADSRQSVFLADLSGDGLTDIVRIRNGEVCYWPNIGYGRFGAKVTMDDSPWFDMPNIFDQRRIRLADIDGSGVTDIIYLGSDGIHIYFNRSGNSWSEARKLDLFPTTDNLSSVTVIDLLGAGTACLVWSSPLPGLAGRPMSYVDLMGGQKPHLMILWRNNLGAETRVRYAPSTKFYLEDKYAGNPWITKLPFPVHVVERVEIVDHISRNRFVTRHAYHHGYFDGVEREFRGFGMVEQWDAESFAALSESDTLPDATNIDGASHVPPVYIKTWFHTGAFEAEGRISKQFEKEYYREGAASLGQFGLTDEQLAAMMLRDTELPADRLMPDGTRVPYSLSAEEAREACRSLKGSILRIETYAQDGAEEADRPYTVSERNYTIELLQPRDGARHAVFFTHARESIDFHYERKLFDAPGKKTADPRVTHSLTLNVDNYGNILRSADAAYGRRLKDAALSPTDQKKQERTHVTFVENVFTNPILEPGDYRTPLPCESRTYELLKIRPLSNIHGVTDIFQLNELNDQIESVNNGAATLPYQEWNADEEALPAPRRRLIESVRTLYRKNDFSGPLTLADLESLALPYEAYKLAFTPELVTDIFKRYVNGVEENLIPDQTALLGKKEDGGYVHSEGDANWWIPSGQIFYSPNETDTAAQELSFARQHFFQPRRFRDPFGQSATIDYAYDLLLKESRDPLGNTVLAENDFRALAPRLLVDPNGNRSFAKFDALGLVVATAVCGKVAEDLGDSVDDFTDDDAKPTLAQLQDFMTDRRANASAHLKSATSRFIYDLDRYRREGEPPYAATLARETHVNDPLPPDGLKIQVGFSYSDGFGREIQKKIQAEPGRLDPDDPRLPVVNPRWVGNGWTIFNNKGKPVRQYEPFFDDAHDFKFARIVGVSPVLFYDPVERVIATLHPNNTYEKVVFDPWRQETWDVNDTVALDPRADDGIKGYTEAYFKKQPPEWKTWLQQRAIDPANPPADTHALPPEKRAAVRALPHAGTPAAAYFDTLGRTFLTIADNGKDANGNEQKYLTSVEFDIEGNQRAVIDARKRVVMRYDYDLLGNRIHQNSMDAGEGWMLNDVMGKPIRAWDTPPKDGHPVHTFRAEYDELRRPARSFVKGSVENDPGREILYERMVYGEKHPRAEALNLRARVFLQLDGAGMVRNGNSIVPANGREEAYDFKGNLLRSSRRLANEYKDAPDWKSLEPLFQLATLDLTAIENDLTPMLEAEFFEGSARFDALNRLVQVVAPHSNLPNKKRNVIRPGYNEANLLERMDIWLERDDEPEELLDRATAEARTGVSNIDYNAKGQRQQIEYKNGVNTEYTYEKETFRLARLETSRGAERLQNLQYSYDSIGNITSIRDEAQQTVIFGNQRVNPHNDYTYDAIYRLIKATGREHLGQTVNPPTPYDEFNFFHIRRDPNDPNVMGRYVEEYNYDEVGNILFVRHRGADPQNPGWKRCYQYAENSNRLLSASNPKSAHDPDDACSPHYAVTPVLSEKYSYDTHGNMISMPHLQAMGWDFRDQLRNVNLGGGGNAFYVYDASGQRVRKVWEKNGQADERIYLGGFEVFRSRNGIGGEVTLERETLQIMDDKQRIALVETRTVGDDPAPRQLIRYQLGNHLGSSAIELDHEAAVISCEEYFPYGSASYQSVRSQTETPKRYRYTGRERDEESGLCYHGARYYAPWVGRWTSCDPIGISGGINLYLYSEATPVCRLDVNGTDPTHPEDADIHQTWTEGPPSSAPSTPASANSAAIKSQSTPPPPTSLPEPGGPWDVDADRIVRRPLEEGAGRWRAPSGMKPKANDLAKKTGFDPKDRHLGHEEARWKLKAGEKASVRNERATGKGGNLSRGAAIERPAAQQAKAEGRFARVKGKDPTAPVGARQTPKSLAPSPAKPSATPPPAAAPPAAVKPPLPVEPPPVAKPSAPSPPPAAKPPVGPSAVENLAGKLGGAASAVGGFLAALKFAEDLKMHTNPSDPTLGPVGTRRTDSIGTVWIKIDEKTWVTEAYFDKMS